MFVSGFYLSAIVAAGMYLARATPLQVRATCDRTYTVASDDTCDGISAAQSVSTLVITTAFRKEWRTQPLNRYQLALDNPEIDAACDNLIVGETLCLGFQGADCTSVHVVASGDGCDTIATNANTTLATLLANNPNVNAECSNIYPGEVLCTATTLVYSS
ncbi:hypothetical protein H0H92_016133 [Tricholoma furcatifolium]|nr:hypothetical protein H0H92_016133 [Tricholoma furcatifolium]